MRDQRPPFFSLGLRQLQPPELPTRQPFFRQLQTKEAEHPPDTRPRGFYACYPQIGRQTLVELHPELGTGGGQVPPLVPDKPLPLQKAPQVVGPRGGPDGVHQLAGYVTAKGSFGQGPEPPLQQIRRESPVAQQKNVNKSPLQCNPVWGAVHMQVPETNNELPTLLPYRSRCREVVYFLKEG